MMMVGEKIYKLIEAKDAKLDSTPLEASRYDFFSDFNPYYGCKMDKAHITMIGTFPIFLNYCQHRYRFPHFLRVKNPQLTILGINPRIGDYDRNGGMVYDKRSVCTGFQHYRNIQ